MAAEALRASRSISLGAALFAIAARAAFAAGGAHVVDDANVETPGLCHLESWATRYSQNESLINLAPACTRRAWPALEIGAAITSTTGKSDDVVLGPAVKLNLQAADQGVGVALIAGAGYSPNLGRLQSASLIAPVTFALSDRVTLNLNAGWSYLDTARRRDAAFFGAQLELQPWRDLEFMAEGFHRGGDRAGVQAGLRWTPHQGRIDVDLLAGRFVDGVDERALTLGLTVRR